MANAFNDVRFLSSQTQETQDDEFSIPIDMSDILTVCKVYSRLGLQVQSQIEQLTEIGIEEAIKNGFVKVSSLPWIKLFLKTVGENPLFGDATDQACDCIKMIEKFEHAHPNMFKVSN